DVRPFIAAADCIVLPSYYPEGTPRTLLEGAAMGKPLVTTDTPGCREAVECGINGYLCLPADASALARSLTAVIELDADALREMGRQSRLKAERYFDEKIIFGRYRDAIGALAAGGA